MEQINLPTPEVTHFIKYCLLNGGRIINTGFKGWDPMWPSYCNPSIFWDDKDGVFYMIQRNVSYILNGSKGNLWNCWGPLHYSIPQERRNWLETRNFIGTSHNPWDDDFIYSPINMKQRVHQWQFHGLEDARCVKWNGKLYAIGVRRDDNNTGVGRMEVVELDNQFNEVKAIKMKGPDGDKQYCIKNVIPVTDQPWTFIYQASNPVHILKMNPDTGEVTTIVKNESYIESFRGFDMPRGSSQCIPWGKDGNHISCVHFCTMWYTGNKRKFARYYHAFIEYDKDWNIINTSPLFSFDDYVVEFMTGMTIKDDNVYLSLALQDNCSYILEIPKEFIHRFIEQPMDLEHINKNKQTHTIWDETPNQNHLFSYALDLFKHKDMAGAYTWFSKAVDLYPYTYDERFMTARAIAELGHRDNTEIGLWMDCIEHDPTRPEAYCAAAMYYFCRGGYMEAWYWITKAMEKMVSKRPSIWYSVDDIRLCYRNILSQTKHYDEVDASLKAVKAF